MDTNENTQKFCMKCGAELEPDAVFCSSCGTKQNKADMATPPENHSPVSPAVQANVPPAPVFPQQPSQFQQPQGYPQQQMQPGYPPQPQMIIAQSPKSMGLALILTFLFGPLGLLYASVKAGLIMICVAIVVVPLTLGFGYFITVPVSMAWAYTEVEKYNKALMSGQMPPQSF